MGEMIIRRNRGFAVPQYQSVEKTGKQTGTAQTQKAARTAGTTGISISETLQKLMGSQTESQIRESRRTLQLGEGVLAEVRDRLDRIAELAEEASGGGEPDRAALQKELEELRTEIDRMIKSASVNGTQLFLDEDTDMEDGTEVLLYAVMSGTLARQDGAQALPPWLTQAIASSLTAERMLAMLGLNETAGGADLLAAIANSSLDGNAAAGYLAAIYLGTVIAGGSLSGNVDLKEAMEGLRQLLEKVSEGVSPDEAIEQLTDGAFTSLSDFESQFTGGTALDLQQFLMNMLLADGASLLTADSPLLTLLAGMEGGNPDLMMSLLTALQSAGGNPDASAAAETGNGMAGAAGTDAVSEHASAGGMDAAGPAADGASAVLRMGAVQVTGRDLSGVSFNAANQLIIGGTADVVIQGTDAAAKSILITGSGTVTLQDVKASALTVDTASARVFSAGANALGIVQLGKNAALTLGGSGLLQMEALKGDSSNSLHVTGGAVVMTEKNSETLAAPGIPVLLDGGASLAARAANVSNIDGKPMEPFDIIWKTLLPGWDNITSLTVDGRQGKMNLPGGSDALPARVWLETGDPSSHGYPAHALVIRGRDQYGHLRTRYAYLRWNQREGAFQEVSMYPNPFRVTGGKKGQDWTYEEMSQTLHILSERVTAVSGGAGTDANQVPFSGRIALADGIGAAELILGGVTCWVSAGRAFDLGRENDVALILESGKDNHFESGAGCAGISLGDGTSLCIDCTAPQSSRTPDGTLTAKGGSGGAGIGRDSGAGREQTSQILIRGGVITASGSGGGAGIGAGKRGAMGPVAITGGTVTSTGGKGGGAGIGGALGAPVGDISIRGGSVSAAAAGHAAAIGAGMQGESGDILITGTARIVKAVGGDPGADIGACLFGTCGKVLISGGANIGRARLWTQAGVSLHMGEDTATLPQFRLSFKALHLSGLRVSTREYARTTRLIIDADRRWVTRIQDAYRTMQGQLEQSFGGFHSIHRDINMRGGLVRDTAAASSLLEDTRQSILLQSSRTAPAHSKRGSADVWQLLLW